MAISNLMGGVNITLPAAAAVGEGIRVTIDSSGNAAIATATTWEIGTVVRAAAAAADIITVNTKIGVKTYTASKAIAIGAPVYKAAAGKLTDAAGTAPHDTPFGVALSAAAADLDLIKIVVI